MRGSILSILGLFILVSGSEASLSSYNRTINFIKEAPPAFVYWYGRQKEKIIDIDDELFTNMESFSDLETLLTKLGITDWIEDVPIYQPPQTSKRDLVPRLTRSNDVGQRFRSTKQKRNLMNPKQAHCKPELKTVDLRLEKLKLSEEYYPTCIRINQCGGCCHKKDIHECGPIASEKVIVRVFELKKLKSIASHGHRVKAKIQYVSVDEHTQCDCICKSTEDKCDLTIQKFDKLSCSCKCTNTDKEVNKCYRKDSHAWDSKTCKCLCRHQLTCYTGQIFDMDSCTCKENNRRDVSNLRDFFKRATREDWTY